MFPSYLFKPKFKIDGKFNASGIQTMVFEIILQKGIVKISLLKLAEIFRLYHLLNGNIFVKTVNAIRKNKKTPSELFQIKFSYLIFIRIFAVI